jgi:hypothetical protein
LLLCATGVRCGLLLSTNAAMTTDQPGNIHAQRTRQKAIGSALQDHYGDVVKEPPPQELTKLLAKVDRRSGLAPKR